MIKYDNKLKAIKLTFSPVVGTRIDEIFLVYVDEHLVSKIKIIIFIVT